MCSLQVQGCCGAWHLLASVRPEPSPLHCVDAQGVDVSKYLFPDRPGDGDIDWVAFFGASALSHETSVQPGGGEHTRRCRPPLFPPEAIGPCPLAAKSAGSPGGCAAGSGSSRHHAGSRSFAASLAMLPAHEHPAAIGQYIRQDPPPCPHVSCAVSQSCRPVSGETRGDVQVSPDAEGRATSRRDVTIHEAGRIPRGRARRPLPADCWRCGLPPRNSWDSNS